MTAAVAVPPAQFRRADLWKFILYFISGVVSLAGSAIAGLALLVYIYIKADLVTPLGWAYALPLLPFVLASPLAGPLVDRWGVAVALRVGDLGQLLNMAWLGAMVLLGKFAVWQVFVVVAVAAVFRSLTLPALETAIPLLVPKPFLGRANGLRMLMTGVGAVLGPMIAGILLYVVDLWVILLIDCATFVFALVVQAFIPVPKVLPNAPRSFNPGKLIRESREAWRYITARHGMVLLLVILCLVNFAIGVVEVLMPPILLAFSTTRTTGTIYSVAAIGMVTFSLALSLWRRPQGYIRVVLLASYALAASMIVAALRPNVALIAFAAFLFLGSATVVIGTIQTIWQLKTEPELLGRTAALKNGAMIVAQMIADLIVGVLADISRPLVGNDHVRWPFVATLVGEGPRRGFSLLLMLMGVLLAVGVLLTSLSPRLRRVERELPDAIPDVIAAAQGLPDGGRNGDEVPSDPAARPEVPSPALQS